MYLQRSNGAGHLLKEPLGGGGGAADANGGKAVEPGGVYLGRPANHVGTRVYATAQIGQDLAVGGRFP